MVTAAPVEPILQVRDLEVSWRFYRDVLGFETFGEMLLPNGIQLVALRLGGSVLKLKVSPTPLDAVMPEVSHTAPAYGFFALTINVPSVAAVLAACADAGYPVERPFTPLPHGAEGAAGSIRDPDGTLVDLFEGAPPWQAVTAPTLHRQVREDQGH